MPVLTLPAAPEFLSNYLLFNAHLISAAPRDDLHCGGVPVIVYFAIATTCPCLSRRSPKKCKICRIYSSFFLFFVSVSNLVLNFYWISFCFQQVIRSAGAKIVDHRVPFLLKFIIFALFFLCDEEEEVAGGYMCVHCNILYGCPLTYEVFLRCHY